MCTVWYAYLPKLMTIWYALFIEKWMRYWELGQYDIIYVDSMPHLIPCDPCLAGGEGNSELCDLSGHLRGSRATQRGRRGGASIWFPDTFDSMAYFILIYSGTGNIWRTKAGMHEFMGSRIGWWIDSITYCNNQCHFNFDLIAHMFTVWYGCLPRPITVRL
jgi:hypothetical protein